MPVDRRAASEPRRGVTHDRDQSPVGRRRPTSERGPLVGEPGGARPATREAVAVERGRARSSRRARAARRRVGTGIVRRRARGPARGRGRGAWRWRRPGARTGARPRRAASIGERVVPAELVPSAASRSAPAPWVAAVALARGCARTARGRRRPSAVAPEVEQAPGDDVALDLGAAAVDGGGPRVEELAAPALAVGVVAERSPARRAPSSAEVEHRLLGGRQQHLVDRRLRRRACPPVGHAVLGGARARRGTRRASWVTSPSAAGSSAPGGAASSSCCSRRCRNAARCHSAVLRSYGSRSMATAQPWPSSPSVRSNGTTTSSKNTSQNSGAPCMVSIGRTRDAGRVHVDEQRGDAAVGRLGACRCA